MILDDLGFREHPHVRKPPNDGHEKQKVYLQERVIFGMVMSHSYVSSLDGSFARISQWMNKTWITGK